MTRPQGWGTKAEGMPDDCHDECVPQGRLAVYFPYRWDRGVAYYLCELGHRWTCGWGHSASGIAPESAGRAHLLLLPAEHPLATPPAELPE